MPLSSTTPAGWAEGDSGAYVRNNGRGGAHTHDGNNLPHSANG